MTSTLTPWWFRAETSLLQVLLIGFGGPLLLGIMGKVRARAERRVGPPITQTLRDIRKLVAKQGLRPSPASLVYTAAPVIVLSTAIVASAISPLISVTPSMGNSADLFVIVYLLLLGSITVALAGLDTAGAFGGMGSSRAMTIGALAEPALLVGVLALSVQARTTNLPFIVTNSLAHPQWIATPARLLAFVALAIVAIAETGRLPVDNPSTHLELTMIHEAMILDFAGRDLGLISLGEAMRTGYLYALVAALFFPWGAAQSPNQLLLVLGILSIIIKMILLGLSIALVEVHSAKLRLFRVPELLAGAFALSSLAVITELVTR